MSTKLSIATMNNGGIVEAIDEALELLAKNIADINTEPDKMREITIKLQIKPDANRSFGGAKVTVVPKLQPQQAQQISIIFDKDKTTGNPAMFEAYSDHNAAQARLEGTMPAEVRGTGSKNVTPFKAAASAGV